MKDIAILLEMWMKYLMNREEMKRLSKKESLE